MIRAGGGSYRNRLPSLPPPPPPPPPLPQNPSSSSTLSPLARPFTLDHVFHSSPPPPSYHPLPAVDRPSASLLPSHTAISSDGSLRTQPSTGPGADPFAHYYSNSQPPAIVDSFRPSSAFSGVGTDPWNRPFDEEIGHGMRTDAVWSWTEPSLGYKVPPFQEEHAGNGCSYYDSDSYGVWHGNHPNSVTEVHFRSQSPEWLHNMQPENYEQNIRTPISAPTALLKGIHCSGTTVIACSVSSQIFSPSDLRAVSNVNSTLSYKTVLHEVPYNTNGSSTISSKLKEPNLNQNLGGKRSYDEQRGEDYSLRKTKNLGLRLTNLVITDAYPSICSSVEPDKSVKSSSEAIDQHSLAVDSPCWKGTPSSRQSPFTVDEMLVQTAIEESKDYVGLCQDRRQLLESVERSKNPAEQDGNLIFDEKKKKSTSEKLQCSSVISSIIHQRPENANKKLSDYRKDDSENEILFDVVNCEHKNKTIEVESKVQVGEAVKSCETESTVVNKFPQANGIEDYNKGSCSSPQKNTKELVKAMHDSSIKLLCTNFSGDDELEPHDYRLLYSVINNIALVLKDKKAIKWMVLAMALMVGHNEGSKGFVGWSPHCSGLEAALSFCRCSSTDDGDQINMNGKMHSVGHNNVNDEVRKDYNTNLRKVNDITQIYENALSKSFSEREENTQTLLYKTLWIEAEAAACRLKYELQLTQTKTRSENLNSSQSDTSSSLPFAHDLQGHKGKGVLAGTIYPTEVSERISKCQNPHEASATCESNKSEDIESSLMSRYKVLKDRSVSSSYRSTEELDPEDTGTCSGTREVVYGSPDVANTSSIKDLPVNLADLGFMESVMQPYDEDRPTPRSSHLNAVQPLGAGSDDELGSGLNISGYVDAKRKFPGPLNGSLIQSYMTYNQGNWSFTSGYENSSSEWEHVQGEESTQH
ncbi:hypothetical protein OPV22_018825 [Ensete ventricosum]|uniref:Uncharacterized protein n=1 Tax=Ensete ventricosum TaxID=4639 RepID=A0AAV8PGM3_ENSVE|nr:hypothetical protein OPV22_018825 [Ensete ventricosum]